MGGGVAGRSAPPPPTPPAPNTTCSGSSLPDRHVPPLFPPKHAGWERGWPGSQRRKLTGTGQSPRCHPRGSGSRGRCGRKCWYGASRTCGAQQQLRGAGAQHRHCWGALAEPAGATVPGGLAARHGDGRLPAAQHVGGGSVSRTLNLITTAGGHTSSGDAQARGVCLLGSRRPRAPTAGTS